MTSDTEKLARLYALRARVHDEIVVLEERVRRRRRPRRRNGHRPPCGTEEGYQSHRHYGEPRDAACKAAHVSYNQARVVERRLRAVPQ